MKTELKNISGCRCLLNIELSSEELNQEYDQVYADLGKRARVPGFRRGKVPRDLLETYYAKEAQERVIKRAIPEYYLKAARQQRLSVVSPPEIDQVQFKNHGLYFKAEVDLRPTVKLKGYKNLKIIKKKIKTGQADQAEKPDAQAKARAQAKAEIEIKVDMERQLIEQLLTRANLELPQSLVQSQMQELLNQLKVNCLLRGEKKEQVESKEKELQEQAQAAAVRRVKLSFILDEIAQQENIQVEQEDLAARIAEIAQRAAKSVNEVKEYLEKQNFISALQAELRDRKTMEFLLKAAKIEAEK